jgi:replicative DNA helicase
MRTRRRCGGGGVRAHRALASGPWNWFQLLLSGNGDRWHPRGLNHWLRDLGIFGQRSREKRLPGAVYMLDDRQVAFSCGISGRQTGPSLPEGRISRLAGVHFSTASQGLADDVAALLLRLGIVARIRSVSQGADRGTQ